MDESKWIFITLGKDFKLEWNCYQFSSVVPVEEELRISELIVGAYSEAWLTTNYNNKFLEEVDDAHLNN